MVAVRRCVRTAQQGVLGIRAAIDGMEQDGRQACFGGGVLIGSGRNDHRQRTAAVALGCKDRRRTGAAMIVQRPQQMFGAASRSAAECAMRPIPKSHCADRCRICNVTMLNFSSSSRHAFRSRHHFSLLARAWIRNRILMAPHHLNEEK